MYLALNGIIPPRRWIHRANIINVYGHIHNNPIDEKYNDKNHMCVSLDKTKFKPVLLTTIEDNKL